MFLSITSFTLSKGAPLLFLWTSANFFLIFILEKISRPRYTQEDITIIETVFHKHVVNGTAPSKAEIEEQQAAYPALRNRSYKTLKVWIKNRKNVKLTGQKIFFKQNQAWLKKI